MTPLRRTGRLLVISAPSGSGKTTVVKALLKREPGRVVRSISMTTRPPRAGERHGRDYRFVSRRRFEQVRKNGFFLESAQILGHWYGTPRRAVERTLKAGRDVVLEIDVQGAQQVRRCGLPTTTIFLLPPTFKALRERLERRGTETRAQIQARLKRARAELARVRRYDYAVVNDRLKETIDTVHTILKGERCRVVKG